MCVCKFLSLSFETRFERAIAIEFLLAVDSKEHALGLQEGPASHTALLSCGASQLSQRRAIKAPSTSPKSAKLSHSPKSTLSTRAPSTKANNAAPQEALRLGPAERL